MITLDVKAPTGNRWKQIRLDLVSPAPASDWYRQSAHLRVFAFDRIRPFLTRACLLLAIMIAFVVLPEVSLWAWVLLVPAVLQCILEILLEPWVRVRDAEQWPAVVKLVRPVLTWWAAAYERRELNFTGILGAAAAIINAISVALLTQADEATGWVKVAAFASAILYAVSGVAGPALESTAYSAQASPISRAIGRLRPFYWVALGLAAAGLVWASNRAGLWPADALPYAYLVCLLAYALGRNVREHDRLVAVGGLLAKKSQEEESRRLARGLHDVVSPQRGIFTRLMLLEGVKPEDQIRLAGYLEDLAHLRDKAVNGLEIGESLLPDLRTKINERCRGGHVKVEMDIDLLVTPSAEATAHEPSALHRVSVDLARDVVFTLALNAVTAYEVADAMDRPLHLAAREEDGHVVVTAKDGLAPIPEDVWENPGGNLRNIRHTVLDRGGRLEQHVHRDGGKTITARWPNTYRRLLDMDGKDI